MSELWVTNVYNQQGDGAPNFPNGATVTGIVTATTFKGGAEISSGTISATSATFSGAVSIGGTLTYEDVTNIDSVGVVTARSGVDITSGGLDVTAGGVTVTTGDIDVISGSIGIGTVTPANLLDIHGANGAGGLRLTETNHPNLNRHGRIFEYAGALYFQSRNDTVNGDFIFRGGLDGVEKLRIGSSSQIGIAGANYGTAGEVLTSGGPSAAPQWASVSAGMSEYDVWAMTNNTGASEWDYEVIGGGSAPQAITIARQTTTQNPLFTKIGTGMSYSAGIWTFPSTGHWECTFTHIVQTSTAGTGQQYYMDVTQDNGTSWSPITFIFNTIGSGYGHTQTLIYNFLNVTNVGQQKVRYRWKSDGPCYSKGSTSDLRSSFVWKKVA